jgi:hypothetical protein
MHAAKKLTAGFIFVALIIVLLALPQHAASPRPASAQQPSAPGPAAPGMDMSLPAGQEPIPAYHKQPPSSPLGPTLDPQQFSNMIVQNAYIVAARIKKLLYQQPCYCHCDRSQGHGSLFDCFAGNHGSECNVCMSEDFYTYEQSRKGKTAAQIRAGILEGDWRSEDLAKYQLPLPAATK